LFNFKLRFFYDSLIDVGSDTLQELLAVLAEETGHQLPSVTLAHTQPPLTEEEILKRPFYSVVEEDEESSQVKNLFGKGLEKRNLPLFFAIMLRVQVLNLPRPIL